VVLPSDGYYTTRLLAADELARFGVSAEYVATTEIEDWAASGRLDGVRLVLLETPSNPRLDVCDVAAVARAARAAGAIVAVDNTTATPLGQRPLELGAHLTIGSDTKALTGHSDLLLGHVSTTDDELYARLEAWRGHSGSTPGPFEAWLGHRSMSTLDLRLARQAANAAAVAEVLAASPAVTGVRWPWRTPDPSFELASRQMLRPNGVVSAELASEDAVQRLLAATRLWTAATSFGGVHSTIDRRAQWGADAVAPGFVRLSCGIEDTDDLVSDLAAALDALG
jgi:cystathionine gamma-lyase